MSEYDQYRAVRPIFVNGSLAYNTGDYVPVSNVTNYGYLASGDVVTTGAYPQNPLYQSYLVDRGTFDTSQSYTVSDIFQFGGATYRPKIALTPGAFNPANVEALAGSGFPLLTGKNVFNPAAVTGTDVASNDFIRLATYTGGTAGFTNNAVRAITNVSAGVTSYEWTSLAIMNNSASAGQNVAHYSQGNRQTTTTGPTWAAVHEVQDVSGQADPTIGLVALEVDVRATGTDVNQQRFGIDLVCTTYSGAQGQATAAVRANGSGNGRWINGVLINGTVSSGLNVDTTAASNGLICQGSQTTGVKLKSTMSVGVQVTGSAAVALDTSVAGGGPTGTTATTAVPIAVRMSRGQTVAWEGTSTLQQQLDASTDVMKLTRSGTELVGFDLSSSAAAAVRIATVQVVGTRKTGWTASTGTATRTAFATTTVTLPQLAEQVKALKDDLIAHGLIGT